MALQDRIDRWLGGASRQLARKTSRRGFLARIGAVTAGGAAWTAGAAALPLLPVRRAFAQREPGPGEPAADTPQGDPNACEYWRYCSIDGFLSSCCGGTHRSCPPGTEMSAITWVGTCRNPKDGKDYVISYNDCCGKDTCGRCFCHRNEGDKPVYLPQRSNDINWCMGTREAGVIYNSTVSIVIGVATEDEK